ncbi:hypothetical protein STEG23_033257 [Scotinomys teguina]
MGEKRSWRKDGRGEGVGGEMRRGERGGEEMRRGGRGGGEVRREERGGGEEERVSLCNSLGCPGTHFVDQAPSWLQTHRDPLAYWAERVVQNDIDMEAGTRASTL